MTRVLLLGRKAHRTVRTFPGAVPATIDVLDHVEIIAGGSGFGFDGGQRVRREWVYRRIDCELPAGWLVFTTPGYEPTPDDAEWVRERVGC